MGWTARTRKPTTGDAAATSPVTRSQTPQTDGTRSDAQALRTGGPEHLV